MYESTIVGIVISVQANNNNMLNIYFIRTRHHWLGHSTSALPQSPAPHIVSASSDSAIIEKVFRCLNGNVEVGVSMQALSFIWVVGVCCRVNARLGAKQSFLALKIVGGTKSLQDDLDEM